MRISSTEKKTEPPGGTTGGTGMITGAIKKGGGEGKNIVEHRIKTERRQRGKTLMNGT